MAPRGLSAEEKRVKLLEIFHESKDFYQLKELEKLGPKLKGIVSQSVKEVLQSLVDDGLVQGDKIGSSNFFWSFPSQRGAIMQNRLKQLKETREGHQTQQTELRAQLETEKAARVENESRAEQLKKLQQLKKTHVQLLDELGAYGACDPAKVEEMRRAVTLGKEAAIRWTDNYSMLLSHFTRQHGVDAGEIRRHLGVEEEYEDIC
ncbi:meiotic nuclear division protein 1 [Mycena olivaceomarginata]|uniref:Meiotic nuclear division protein 1 n=1 Tax=Mycena albidolilacea TaxID=1033008 RepID=A0AAD7EQ69_9AGAR|nr:meiotic nuclear division protein 1 [Mycena albidolilacea]KAJ7901829.1 meiotic nuclear division protein 1 [Mycena olivaceomarginata]